MVSFARNVDKLIRQFVSIAVVLIVSSVIPVKSVFGYLKHVRGARINVRR